MQIHQEPSEVEEPATVVEVDEEVDVARFGGVPPCDRPEDANREAPVARAVARISLRRFRRSRQHRRAHDAQVRSAGRRPVPNWTPECLPVFRGSRCPLRGVGCHKFAFSQACVRMRTVHLMGAEAPTMPALAPDLLKANLADRHIRTVSYLCRLEATRTGPPRRSTTRRIPHCRETRELSRFESRRARWSGGGRGRLVSRTLRHRAVPCGR